MDATGERDILIERLENIIKQKDETIALLKEELARLKEQEATLAEAHHDEEMSQLKPRLEKLESTSKEMAATIGTIVEDIIELKSIVKSWGAGTNPFEPEPKPKKEEKGKDILLY
ncbi:MAG: hypothetical protein ACXQT3_05815 [Methermicoccaceae archaeon]